MDQENRVGLVDHACHFTDLSNYDHFTCDFAERTCQGLSDRTPFDRMQQQQWAPVLKRLYHLQ